MDTSREADEDVRYFIKLSPELQKTMYGALSHAAYNYHLGLRNWVNNIESSGVLNEREELSDVIGGK